MVSIIEEKIPEFLRASDIIPLLPPAYETKMVLYTPGEELTDDRTKIRGHGTYEEDGVMKSSLSGVKEEVNKLIIVRPLKSRYNGEIGDVVVGRITEVQQKRWKVDINARQDAALLLSGVNLPGGELRRRSVEDERKMREYLSEGDVISAEVQNVHADGVFMLHTRNFKNGKVSQGVLAIVPPGLIKRTKTHFHDIKGVSVIIGTNGYIWISPLSTQEESGGFARNLDLKVDPEQRSMIARIKCCISILAESRMSVYDTSILQAVKTSLSLNYSVSELLSPCKRLEIAQGTQITLGITLE